MNWITKFILVACTVLAIAGNKALAHVGYSGRDFGTLMYNFDGSGKTVTIATQTISSGFGWADATDTDWGDSHRGKFFRFTLSGTGDVQITAQRNLLGTGTTGTLLPAFSLYSGLGQLSPEQGGHDGSKLSTDNRPTGTEGSLRALGNWSIGNDPTYNTAGDPTSGILNAPRLAYFTYIGNAADGNSANYGTAVGIFGDGTADGYLTATFTGLSAGDYSLWVGGANYGLQSFETGPTTFPTYGVTVSAALVPEPATGSLILSGAALLTLLRRRKSYLQKETPPSCKGRLGFSFFVKRSSTKQPAFTLVELLTVVTIISILSTLGLAATRGVTEKTRTTRCLNDLRQVGTAIQMFTGESGGRMPSVDHGQQISWTNSLGAFLVTNFIGRCPALQGYPETIRVTYGWNDMLVASDTGEGIPVARVAQPSTTIVLAEKQAGGITLDHFHFRGSLGSRGRISMAAFEGEVNTTAHGSKANYLFIDGHVESLSSNEARSRLAFTNPRFLVP
jgi:prepilin-type processing-associated H-X9-DG protein/prepilin-type N-terminal cleavage/methylation domain-containing protein